jgi:hypothetical protein
MVWYCVWTPQIGKVIPEMELFGRIGAEMKIMQLLLMALLTAAKMEAVLILALIKELIVEQVFNL